MANTKDSSKKTEPKTDKKVSSAKKTSAKTAEKEKLRASAAQKQADLYKKKLIHDEIWAFVIIVLGIILLVMSMNPEGSGIAGAFINSVLFGLFGKAAYALPYFMILFGALIFTRRMAFLTARSIAAAAMLFISAGCMFSVGDAARMESFAEAVVKGYLQGRQAGGMFGTMLSFLLLKAVGRTVLYVICGAMILIALLFLINTPISSSLDNARIRHDAYKKAKEEEKQALAEAEARYREEQAEKATSLSTETGKQIGMPFGILSKKDDEDRKKKENIVNLAASETFASKKEEDEESGAAAPKSGSAVEEFFDAKKAERAKAEAEAAAKKEQTDSSKDQPQEAEELQIRWDLPAEEAAETPFASEETDPAASSKEAVQPGILSAGGKEAAMPANRQKILGYVSDDTLFGKTEKTEGFGINGETKKDSSVQSMLLEDFVGQPEPDPAIAASLQEGDSSDDLSDAFEGFDSRQDGRIQNEEAVSESTGEASFDGPSFSKAGKPAFRLSGSQTYQPPVRREAATAEAVPSGQTVAEAAPVPVEKPYEFPPIDLLNKPAPAAGSSSKTDLQSQAAVLEKTLASFGVTARVVDMIQGPAVTRFEVQPATGVKVSRITSLQDDLALNLRAKSLRIEAPIPGKAAVGIEISNETIASVYLREIIDSESFRKAKSRISVGLGKSVAGAPVVADLKKMPHLLVAGATGSGKSVCINSILISLLYKARPDEVKLLLVDPKVVELSNYNGIPHLMVPVVTEPAKAAAALGWAVAEMNDRYNKFAEKSVRDLQSYNEAVTADGEESEKMPQIVIVIDELADLIMASKNQVEDYICRLAQKARAAGMHLIIATQRPSADIITGVIKANIPSRIAFKVSSQIDSRVILDMGGAEKLLGRGDMLYGPQDLSKPERVQGCFVSDEEVNAVIDFLKKNNTRVEYSESVASAMERAEAGPAAAAEDEEDDLLADAVEAVIHAEAASVSALQRRFRIGYNRAARLIDMMEERGIVGPADGGRPRKVLMTLAEYEAGFSSAGDPVPEEIDAYTPF
ncbi:MAG: DNA translocase FtsK 4TM domain-containing protein [Firmicutes bacterium]|nr:DNA translocase FtsK 4TM domain-containing protein [Bacillota bacterium]